jgi:hypothetical protein
VEKSNPMAEPITFDRDIAPLQQKFFGGTGADRYLSKRDKNMYLTQSLDSQLAEQDALRKQEEDQEVIKYRKLNNEASALNLSDTKERIASEKLFEAELPRIQTELDEIMRDPNEDSRTSRIGSFGVKNAKQINSNRSIAGAFNAAANSVRRGNSSKPPITYADLIEEGDDPTILGVTDKTDINASVPPLIAAAAIKRRTENALKTARDNAIYEHEKKQKEKQEIDKVTAWTDYSKAIATGYESDASGGIKGVDPSTRENTLRRFGSKDQIEAAKRIAKERDAALDAGWKRKVDGKLASHSEAEKAAIIRKYKEDMNAVLSDALAKSDPLAVKEDTKAQKTFNLFGE